MADANTLHAKVLTPEGQVFEGDVEQLSTRTAVGELGVLANHVPVLARLRPTELRLHLPGGARSSAGRRARAGCRCSPTTPPCWSARRYLPTELDEGSLRSRVEDAERRLAETEEGSSAHTPGRAWIATAPRPSSGSRAPPTRPAVHPSSPLGVRPRRVYLDCCA